MPTLIKISLLKRSLLFIMLDVKAAESPLLNALLVLNILARNAADAAESLLIMSFRKEGSFDDNEESPLLKNVEGPCAATGSPILATVAADAAVDKASNE
jgi:hypothetical protein